MGLFNLAEMEATIRLNESRIVILEQKVANQEIEFKKLRQTEPITIHLKSQAAQQQETEERYAPLRSDTKPLLEMAAFVRKVSQIKVYAMANADGWNLMREIAHEARDILMRST